LIFCQRTASTFADRQFLFVKKDANKSRTASGKPAKELALPARSSMLITSWEMSW